ncbi:DUF429 domain-containing protein [Geitlerinema sp. PCC 9228]|uniref:DUF429 domain-containing protein n=1 Tax=Geitlerinema sp. PCC 9228 TaxID=111611 RepID=UPI0008F9CC0C|nr:DUF429 domain-containing protein [Geitlerinema sp. PCC 9228]
MRFLGIDFGWRSGDSGLCGLELNTDGTLEMVASECLTSVSDILQWVDELAPAETAAMVAVDAPTIIPNTTGMRVPDRLTHKYFGRYHAGCYPANLQRPFAERTVGLGTSLLERGFRHAPEITAQQPGRFQIEVFPHTAIVRWFRLPRILKYKKGRFRDRISELSKLYDFINTELTSRQPALPLLETHIPHPQTATRMKDLKAIEDRLDALICAYLGVSWWYWGESNHQVLGNKEQGYIIVPAECN